MISLPKWFRALLGVLFAVGLVTVVQLLIKERDPAYIAGILLMIGAPTLLLSKTSHARLLGVVNLALAGGAISVFVQTGDVKSVFCSVILAYVTGRFLAIADLQEGYLRVDGKCVIVGRVLGSSNAATRIAP